VPIDLDLSKNEGRTRAGDLLAAVPDPTSAISRYPEVGKLRQALADLHGLPRDSVLVTAGGDDALFRCFLARVSAGTRVFTTTPTFEMIARYAGQRDADLVEVPWWRDGLPTDEVMSSITGGSDVVFLVSPNNPTGAAITGIDLRLVADRAGLVVLDAAYAEFATDDLTPVALELGNVVVVRTMSKAYGLAGLRVGYLLGSPEVVAEISAHGNPYPVASLSAQLALERLQWPSAELTEFVEEVKRERADLIDLLNVLGTSPLPSEANFVLTRCSQPELVVSAAAALGIALRWFPGRPDLEGMVRITLPGSRPEFERLIAVLGAALAPEALILDMDGVLADVSRSQSVAIIETARSFGIEVGPDDVQEAKAAGNSNDDWDLTRGLLARRGVDVPLQVVTERFESLYQGMHGVPGLKDLESLQIDRPTLARWAAARPLAVVTGRPGRDAGEFLEKHQVDDLVTVLVTRDDAPLKPDPAPVRLALDKLGVSTAWMLGDTPDDVEAARAAGVVPFGVIAPGDEPERARESLRRAARILDNPIELEGLLP
jgi:histidinol-phosphate aminotransferase